MCLLAEKPIHAYEIAQVIEERGMREWTRIGFSSIYYLLKKMLKAGWVERKIVESEIGGPQKSVFTLTTNGREIWQKSVLDAVAHPDPGDNLFLIGISAAPLLENSEFSAAINTQRIELHETEDRLREKLSKYENFSPPHVIAMFEYSLMQIQAAKKWIDKWGHILGRN